MRPRVRRQDEMRERAAKLGGRAAPRVFISKGERRPQALVKRNKIDAARSGRWVRRALAVDTEGDDKHRNRRVGCRPLGAQGPLPRVYDAPGLRAPRRRLRRRRRGRRARPRFRRLDQPPRGGCAPPTRAARPDPVLEPLTASWRSSSVAPSSLYMTVRKPPHPEREIMTITENAPRHRIVCACLGLRSAVV